MTEKLVLSIPGMHCASCVSRLEEALRSLPGVSNPAVRLASRTAALDYEPAAVEPEAIRRAVEALGYEVPGMALGRGGAQALFLGAEEARSRDLALRFVASAALWAAVMMEHPLGLSPYTAWLFATPAQAWCAWPFHRGLWRSLRRRSPDMDFLVSLSTWAAYLFSTWAVFLPESLPAGSRAHMLESASGLIAMITLGRWIEARLRRRSHEAIAKLMHLSPKTVRLLRDGSEALVPLSEVSPGQRILVRPGEVVGLDGVVEEGASAVDEALLTGESMPVEKTAGARVYGGTVNKTGALIVSVSRTGSETALARIIESVQAAASSKPPIQRLADRIAAVFVPAVIVLALAAAAAWLWKGPPPRTAHALTAFISVLAVACPCALGLATPMAIVIGVGRAAELGIYFRNAEALEKLGAIGAVIFDKTGTLTEGRPDVLKLAPAEGSDPADLLRRAVTAEQRSEHPFAEALRRRARADGVRPDPIDSFEALPGRGVVVSSRGRRILAGSLSWLASHGIEPEEALARRLRAETGSVLGVASDGSFLGCVTLADRLRADAKETVSRLRKRGLDLLLVSGDRNPAVHRVAEELGIRKVYAEVLPQEKARIVGGLQDQGLRVAMVGEGFNDAPALSRADVGVALAGGTDVASEAADVTLVRPDLKGLLAAMDLSARIRRTIRANLAWAFAYNALLLPVAAGAAYPFLGLTLKPHYAGAAMALSSVSVILNSLRLRRFKP